MNVSIMTPSPSSANLVLHIEFPYSQRSTKSLTDKDVNAILGSMTEDQREHHFKNFHPSYLKVSAVSDKVACTF